MCASRSLVGVLIGVCALLLLPLAAPAQAGQRVFVDPADTPAGIDMTKVRVIYKDRVRVRVVHNGFHAPSSSEITLWFDTKRRNPGPQYRYRLFPNSEFTRLHRVDTWRDSGTPVRCRRLGGFADQNSDKPIRFAAGGNCFGNPGKIRVAVRTKEERPGGTYFDWAPTRRAFFWAVTRY
jgi:hypothetical protein